MNDLLYGVVQWINSHPILDGIKYFTTKDAALKYAQKLSEEADPFGITVSYTIIRLEKSI